MSSRGPHEPPSNAAIDALFARADGARVLDGGASDGRPLGTVVLWEVPRAELAALRATLRIREARPAFHCMCLGDLAIELLDRGARDDAIGFHHAASVRVHGFGSDAELVDGAALLRVLAAHGVPGPLAAWERDVEASRQMGVARAAWVAAAAPALVPNLSRFEQDPMGLPLHASSPRLDEALATLRAAYHDDRVLARVLLEWLGKGAGPWSGYPSYEALPEQLLRKLDLELVARVVDELGDAPDALVGAARFAAAHETVTFRRRLLGSLDPETLARLCAAAERTGVADNVARARYASTVAHEQRARFASPAPFAVSGGLHVLGLGQNGVLSGLVTDGVHLVSVDVCEIVRFDPGSIRPVVLGAVGDGHGELGAAGGRALVTRFSSRTVSSVPIDGSEPLRIDVTDAERPVAPFLAGGLVHYVSSRAPAVVCTSRDGRSVDVRAFPDGVYACAADQTHLHWIGTVPFGGRPRLARMRLADGTVEQLGELPPLESTQATPAFALSPTNVLWPEGQAVFSRPKSGGDARRLFQAGGIVLAIACDEREVWAIVTEEGQDTPWHLERARPGEARSTRIASFARAPYHRHALVLARDAVCFTAGDRILGVYRA